MRDRRWFRGSFDSVIKGAWMVLAMLLVMAGCVFTADLVHAAEDTVKPLPPEKLKAIQDRSNRIEEKLREYSEELERLRGVYVQPLTRAGGVDYVAKRFKQGEGLFKIGDYEHAAILFSDLAENEHLKKDEGLRYKVLYYLAESFYQRHSYLMANEYFKQVIEFGAEWPYYQKALQRLVEIAINVNDIRNARRYFKMMQGGNGAIGDMIKYAYGKYLYNVGKIDEAFDVFKDIGPSSEEYIRSQYFLGVIYVDRAMALADDPPKKDQLLQDAEAIFRSIMADKHHDSEEDRLVKQLAQINVGRILYERSLMIPSDSTENKKKIEKMVAQAMSLYRRIPPESPYYDQAYYELVWIYIRRGAYQDAINALEIMLGSLPDSLYTPEAQLTKADLYARLKKFKEAKKEYMNVVKSWQGTVDLLDELIKMTRGKKAAEIHKDVMESIKQLPLVAFKWLQQEQQVAKTLELEKEIKQLKENLADTKKILDKILYAAKQSSKARVFPVLREGREHGLNLGNRLAEVQKELLKLSNELIAGRLDEKTRQEFLAAQRQRRQLEKDYNKLPKTAKQRIKVKEEKIRKIQHLAELAYRLQLQLEGLNKKIDELIARKERMRANPHTSKRFLKRVDEELSKERKGISEMLADIEKVNNEVEKSIQAIKMGVGDTKEARIRRAYEAALEREREILRKVRQRMSPEELELFTRIESLKDQAAQIESGINIFLNDLDTLGEDWIRHFRTEIEKQKVAISTWNRELLAVGKDVEDTASEVVVANIKNVREHFYSIVLDADVGLLEITWDRWSEIANKLDAEKKQQKQEEKELKQMFEEQKDIVQTGAEL